MAVQHDGDWKLLSDWDENGQRKWISTEDGIHYIVKTETLTQNVNDLIDANKEAYNASEGKRWGGGQVAWRMPLDQYFRHLAEAKKQDDQGYIKKFLNDPDNRAFRTFKGRL